MTMPAHLQVGSSNHAADYWEPLILDRECDTLTEEHARSDNYYGWAKIACEHFLPALPAFAPRYAQALCCKHRGAADENLGFMFATGSMNEGKALENVQLRIGGPRENDVTNCKLGDLRCMRRALGAYMSQRDLQQMTIKSIETPDIRDGNGVPFQIFYGISGNDHAFWSLVNARKVIGFAPEDNSAVRFADAVSAHIAAAKEEGAQ